jgi:hypothetical protein
MGISAAVIGLHFQSYRHRGQLSDLAGQIEMFDDLSRVYARQHDLALLIVLDMSAGQIRRQSKADGSQLGDGLSLPANWKISKVLLASQVFEGTSVSVGCSSQGQSPSYALLLDGKEAGSQWIVFCGMTGQAKKIKDEKTVSEILALTQAGTKSPYPG